MAIRFSPYSCFSNFKSTKAKFMACLLWSLTRCHGCSSWGPAHKRWTSMATCTGAKPVVSLCSTDSPVQRQGSTIKLSAYSHTNYSRTNSSNHITWIEERETILDTSFTTAWCETRESTHHSTFYDSEGPSFFSFCQYFTLPFFAPLPSIFTSDISSHLRGSLTKECNLQWVEGKARADLHGEMPSKEGD